VYAYSFQSTRLFDTGPGNMRRVIPIKDIAVLFLPDVTPQVPL
jgi:hypothetical protein